MADDASSEEVPPLSLSNVLTHTKQIVSVGYADGLLLAGSDDGTLIVWKSSNDSADALECEHDFSIGECVNCISHFKDKQWAIGCGNHAIFINYSSSKVTESHRVQVADEVNCISFNDKLNTAAIADDSGTISLINTDNKSLIKKLTGHENICSCVKFRPKCPKSLVSGGLDCDLILWDYKTGKALHTLNTAAACKQKEETDEASSYLVNPPLVHCLDITSDGLIAAAGLENGKILLLTIGGKSLKLATIIDAHKQGVSCVLLSGSTLISSGNDTVLKTWTLSTARAPGKVLVWATEQQSSNHKGKASGLALTEKGSLIVADESEKLTSYDFLRNTT